MPCDDPNPHHHPCRCGCVLIAGADLKLQGVFTDGDLRRALQVGWMMGGIRIWQV